MAQAKRFLLRLDPRLFDALRHWADDELRSVNAQIEYLLADRARKAGRLPGKRATPAGDDDSSGASTADGDDDAGPGESAGAGVPPGTTLPTRAG
ncbi:MAG TPA: hypothetical protein VMF57_08950 [Solirubrobacteraceae bacterium]|nr:hypothetical protein [Solirubrobacteraceae bacterium]